MHNFKPYYSVATECFTVMLWRFAFAKFKLMAVMHGNILVFIGTFYNAGKCILMMASFSLEI